MSKHRSVRLTPQIEKRIESIAKEKRVNFSAALRFALERGVAAMEREAEPAAETHRRKVLSRGVG